MNKKLKNDSICNDCNDFLKYVRQIVLSTLKNRPHTEIPLFYIFPLIHESLAEKYGHLGYKIGCLSIAFDMLSKTNLIEIYKKPNTSIFVKVQSQLTLEQLKQLKQLDLHYTCKN